MHTSHQTRGSRRRTGTAQREHIVSKKSKNRTEGKGKLPREAKHALPICDRVVENPEHTWRIALLPNETFVVAEDAPLLQLVIQRICTGHVRSYCRARVLRSHAGKITVQRLAYGTIVIENLDDAPAIAQMEFLPRGKLYEEAI